MRKGKVTLSVLIDDAVEFARTHNQSVRNYKCKARIVRNAFGSKAAEDITPQDLDRWLTGHCKTPATGNRYRAFLSLCYIQGQRNGKINVNRHTFCSWLAIAGRSIKDIQVLAGHKTIAMSARYAHLSPESATSASESIV